MGLDNPNLVAGRSRRWPNGPAAPTCHPEAKHWAKGMCRPCYQREYHLSRWHESRYQASRRKAGRDYIARNPDKPERDWLKYAYGVTPADVAAMAEAQGGKCSICHRDDRRLVVDHDHATGLIRGLLCNACNVGIGFLNDDPACLLEAVAYLTKPHEGEA